MSEKKQQDIPYHIAKEMLDKSSNPLYIFDDDADGLAATLALLRYKKGGVRTVKARPELYDKDVKRVDIYDLIVILDMPKVSQQAFDILKDLPVLWLDHHEPQKCPKNCTYINPKNYDKDSYIPTSEIAYNILKGEEKLSLWTVTAGTVADAKIPPFLDEVFQAHPALKSSQELDTLRFDSPIARLVEIFSFAIKGSKKNIEQNIDILKKIDIDDLLQTQEQQTPAVKKLYKNIHQYLDTYRTLVDCAEKEIKGKEDKEIVVFRYSTQHAMSQELSNVLSYKFPDKLLIIARSNGKDIKGSLRSRQRDLRPLLEEAMKGLDGYGGGHSAACGMSISEEDFDTFIDRLDAMVRSDQHQDH